MPSLRSTLTTLLLLSAMFLAAPTPDAFAQACGNGSVQPNPPQSEACDDGDNDNGDGCSSTCAIEPGYECVGSPSVCTLIPVCGDGQVTGDEDCETGDCCTECQFTQAETLCRAAVGECDLPDYCTGSSATCGTDFKSTDLCRAAAGECDADDFCNGTDNACPADAKLGTGTLCRADAGLCDAGAEFCDGVNNDCPASTPENEGTLCRAAAGDCDVDDFCDGISSDCPDAKSTSLCRAAAGACDLAESCDGTSNNCPADLKSTAVCRASGGVCDVAESCDGTNNNCPADGKESSATQCRPANGVCDAGAEFCTGTSNACPADVPANAGSLCRASTGICDPQEVCDGTNSSCPADAKSTSVCRAAAGDCDTAETCDGTNGACPADAKLPSTTECRPEVHPDCDDAEFCTGTTNNCPDDQLDASCGGDDDGIACTEATCLATGECATADTCVEICRGPGYWQNHSGFDKNGVNVGQEVLDEAGPLLVCGQEVDETTQLGQLDSALEGLCMRVQGVKQRPLYRVLLTTAFNCAISEGGTCDQILERFTDVSFSDCSDLCAGSEFPDGPTLKQCKYELGCFNGGGRIIDGVCVKGTCADDSEVYCSNDEDCLEDCVPFEDSCKRQDLCSEDLDAPATICPDPSPATSPRTCNQARHNDCTIDNCPELSDSCAGQCGGSAPSGCYCDSLSCSLGDGCPDRDVECPGICAP